MFNKTTAGIDRRQVRALVRAAIASRMLARRAPFKVQGPRVGVARAVGSFAIGSFLMGAFTVGALAVGSLAVGRVAIGRFGIRHGRIKHLRIDELEVGRFRVFAQDSVIATNGARAAKVAEPQPVGQP